MEFATGRLADVDTMHAMTIHKSQGSQADEVTVLLPPEDSRLLTRELFYTAVTRAKKQVRVVGSEAAIRAAIARRVDARLRAWPAACAELLPPLTAARSPPKLHSSGSSLVFLRAGMPFRRRRAMDFCQRAVNLCQRK